MRHNMIETLMGLVVLLAAGFFLIFAYQHSQYSQVEGYYLKARFERVDGIEKGSPVKLSGVKIGAVVDVTIDEGDYLAMVTLNIKDGVKLPKDTSAEVVSNGLIGDKYIALVPGGDEEFLKDNSEILYTQASVSLEAMIGQLIFNKKEDSNDKEKDS